MNKLSESIRRGPEGAIACGQNQADATSYRVHVPQKIDFNAIRTKLGMKQEEFAGRC